MTTCRSGAGGWWGALVLLVLLVGGAAPSLAMPQLDQGHEETATTETDRSTDPVFNVWEYAIISDRRHLQPQPAADLAPAASPGGQEESSGQSACMWAIVNCCHGDATSRSVARQSCFEYNGCAGAWFQDLCSEEFVQVAHTHILGVFGNAFN